MERVTTSSSDHLIRRKEIPQIVNNEFHVSAWNEWCRWKRFGLPHGKGWIHEKALWVDVIELIEEEHSARQRL